MNKVFNYFIHPLSLIRMVISHYFGFIPDKIFLRIDYFLWCGEKLNLKTPQTFNEKLQWYKLYYRDPLFTKLADKYEVKKYVSDAIGKEHVVECYGVWDSFDDINFEQLPDQFVLKCTHNSGCYVICDDKSTFDKAHARKILLKGLRGNYFIQGREWVYKNVPPRLIAEKYIDSLGKPESTEYKLTCFDGKVKVITVCGGIAHAEFEKRSNDNFDCNWNRQNWHAYYKPSGKEIKQPAEMDEIIAYAEKLSAGIPQVRVDFYVVNGHVYFGEMTFYTWSGFIKFTPPEWNDILGSWFKLPEKKLAK